MMQKDVIKPSSSPWASLIVLVQKKDGIKPFYVDYCKLNAKMHTPSQNRYVPWLKIVQHTRPCQWLLASRSTWGLLRPLLIKGAGLKLQPTKRYFFRKAVTCLGHIVSE